MSACCASDRPTHRPLTIAALLLGLASLAAATPAAARRVPADSSVHVQVSTIDVGGVRIQRSPDSRLPAHLKGDVTVNGRHVSFDDSLDIALPRAPRAPRIALGPGIHIESDDASIVRMGSDILIDSTETVDDAVVALFGNVTVRGQVGGDVVAVLGSVKLEPGAVVEGDAVAVGGALDQAADAVVHGQSVSLTFLPIHAGVPPLRALVLALFGAWLLAMISGGLLSLLFPQRIIRVAQTVAERTGWSLLFGLLLPPLAVITAVLLMVTLIGIPVAFLLPLVYLFTLWTGAVAAAYLLGCRATGRAAGSGIGIPLLVGTLVVGVLFGFGALFAGVNGALGSLGLFFPLLGVLLATSLSVIGSGAVIVSRFGSPPRPAVPSPAPYPGAPPGAPPPGPAPVPPAAV
jgi:hypothetical protein